MCKCILRKSPGKFSGSLPQRYVGAGRQKLFQPEFTQNFNGGIPRTLGFYVAANIGNIDVIAFAGTFTQCFRNICIAKAITIAAEQSAVEVENHEPFGAKWSIFCRLKVRSYVLAANVAGTLKVAPLQILKFPVVLPHKFLDAEKFNLRFSDASEITEIADKLRWYRYQKGLRQRDAADYAGIDRSTYIHYEEAGRDFYPKKHMEKLAELFEVPLEDLLDDYKAALWWLLPVVLGERFS